MTADFPTPPPRTLFSSDKGEVHIPGAGTLGMYLLLASLSILFASSIIGYLYVRFVNPQFAGRPWPPPEFPPLPRTLWISTLAILLSSVTIQYALISIRRDRQAALLRGLVATLSLGLLFLILQGLNWWEIYAALPPNLPPERPYLMLFYVLTGLHAAHVIGGLIPLIVVTVLAARRRYVANYHPGVRYNALYWHFLDIIWVLLFSLLYLF